MQNMKEQDVPSEEVVNKSERLNQFYRQQDAQRLTLRLAEIKDTFPDICDASAVVWGAIIETETEFVVFDGDKGEITVEAGLPFNALEDSPGENALHILASPEDYFDEGDEDVKYRIDEVRSNPLHDQFKQIYSYLYGWSPNTILETQAKAKTALATHFSIALRTRIEIEFLQNPARFRDYYTGSDSTKSA